MTVAPWPAATGCAQEPEPSGIPTDLALESAQVGTWEWDFGRQLLRVDSRWCAAMRLDPCPGADHLARWMRQLHPDDVADFQRRCEALRGGAERFEAEYRMLRQDSRWVWVLQRGRVVERAPDGGAQRVCGVCIEIDDRKLAQMALAESESRHATALWGARAAFWQWQISNADVTVQSPLWFAMTGYTRAQWESIPKPWFARMHPQDRPEVERQIHEHVAGSIPAIEVEYRIRTASDEWKWMLTRGRGVAWDFEGRATCCIGVSLDVDAHKRTERALASMEVALDAARGAMWDWDLRTGELSHSGFYHRMLGVDRSAGPTQSPLWESRVHPEDLADAQEALRQVLEGCRETFEALYRLQHADGGWRWVMNRGRIRDRHADGSPARLVGFLVEVTERVEAQAVLRRDQRRWGAVAANAQGFSFEHRLDARGELVPQSLSEEAAGVLGGTLEQLTVAGGLDGLVEEEHRSRLQALLAQARAGQSARGELRVRTPAGVVRWLETGMVPVHDPRSQVTAVQRFAQDITARRLAELSVRESAALLSTLVQASPGWLCLLDRELRLKLINRPFGRYGVEDLIGRNALDIAPPGRRQELERWHRQALETGRPVSFDFHFSHGGAQLCYEHQLVPVLVDGAVRHIAATITDVTEVRRAQAAGRQLQRLAETSADWLALFDRQLRCLYLNRPMRGVEPGSWIGASVEDFAPPTPADRARVRAIFEAVVATGEPQDFEHVVSSEPLRCVEVCARAVLEDGAVAGVVVNLRDVSERRARQDLLRAQARILEALEEAVVVWEPASGLIRLANPAFERLLGRLPGALQGRPVEALLRLPAGCRERLLLWEAMTPALPEGGEAVQLECARAEGSADRVSGVVTPLPVGERMDVLLVVKEADPRGRLEREIVELVSREEQRIGAELHEELGQDLTSIALLLRGAVAQLRGGSATAHMDLEEAIDRVNHAIEGVRALARGLSPGSAPGGGLVAAIQALAVRVSERHGVRVAVQADLAEPLPLRERSAGHVHRIVQEALTNVVRHSRATSARITLSSGHGRLEVRVHDSGRGLPPGVLEGNGLGLTMMRHRAEALGGQLFLESDGSGTQVRLTCPLEASPVPPC
jgi:PAS domain S-box-containing protein